jgi:FkbM family methyltransferase
MSYEGHPDQRFGHITYSQNGEDLLILNLFEQLGIDKPSYLDLGAHHPINISNTALLYQRRSRGVNIEANPYLMEAFRIHRPEDINVNVGVSVHSEITLDFMMYDDHNGRNTFSEAEVKRAKKEMVGRKISKTIRVLCKPIDQIVREYCNFGYPHFLNIDLEGIDWGILNEADFSKSFPKVICVETRDRTSMCEMMRMKEYDLVCPMGDNLIFVRWG